jgi:hypothetical protein
VASHGKTYSVAPSKSTEKYAVLQDSVWDPTAKQWIHKCGESLARQEVIHPIHDSGLPLAGSGNTHTETVPYCPKCGEAPSAYGAPLDSDPADQQDLEILRRLRKS